MTKPLAYFVAGCLGLFIFLVFLGMWGIPQYNVWQKGLAGQAYFEAARADDGRQALVQTALLPRANSNHFNAILPPEPAPSAECGLKSLLAPAEQVAFLAAYTADFLDTLFAEPEQSREAAARIGANAAVAVPAAVHTRSLRCGMY